MPRHLPSACHQGWLITGGLTSRCSPLLVGKVAPRWDAILDYSVIESGQPLFFPRILFCALNEWPDEAGNLLGLRHLREQPHELPTPLCER